MILAVAGGAMIPPSEQTTLNGDSNPERDVYDWDEPRKDKFDLEGSPDFKGDSPSNYEESKEQQKRRLIKVDFSVLNDSDNDDDTEDLSDDTRTEMTENDESNKSSVWHRRTGTRSQTAQNAYQRYMDSALECKLPQNQSKNIECRIL